MRILTLFFQTLIFLALVLIRLLSVELEVDPRRSEEEQIQIVVMALLDEDKDDLVDWVVEILKNAVVERYKQTFRTEDELADNPDLMHSVEGVQNIRM